MQDRPAPLGPRATHNDARAAEDPVAEQEHVHFYPLVFRGLGGANLKCKKTLF